MTPQQTFLDSIAAIRTHDAKLADEFAALGNVSLSDVEDWLELHFPRGDWGTQRIIETPDLIRTFPPAKVVR